jgi:hypothetical protein
VRQPKNRIGCCSVMVGNLRSQFCVHTRCSTPVAKNTVNSIMRIMYSNVDTKESVLTMYLCT